MGLFQSDRFAGWSAYLGAAATIIGFVTLILFFSVGQPFGTINDVSSIVIALATLPVLFALHKHHRASAPLLSLGALIIGVVSSLVAALLQTLFVVKAISIDPSSKIVTVAFGVFGISLAIFNYLAYSNKSFSAHLASWGIVAGAGYALVALGFLLGGQDHPLTYIGGLAAIVAYPIWTIWYGKLLLAGK
jgi:hypothetical protein